MTSITATALRQNIYQTIAQVNADCEPILITNSKGKGAVLVGEDEWAAIEETLYLSGIPGMVESLESGKAEPLDACVSENELGSPSPIPPSCHLLCLKKASDHAKISDFSCHL